MPKLLPWKECWLIIQSHWRSGVILSCNGTGNFIVIGQQLGFHCYGNLTKQIPITSSVSQYSRWPEI